MKQFSDIVIDHFTHPRNMGTLSAPHGEGTSDVARGGQFIRVQVMLEGNHVAEARFQTIGCVPAIACGSWLTEWVRGRSVAEVQCFTAQLLIDALAGLPKDKLFCAQLAVDAMSTALRNATENRAVAQEVARP